MDILIVRRRGRGWIAYFQSRPDTIGTGPSKTEAIGRLLLDTGRQPVGFVIEVMG